MLQQTRVDTVLPYFTAWMRAFPDVYALAAASEERVLSLWQGLGYYRRARNLHSAAKAVVDRYGGVFPSEISALCALPGIGEYTACAIRAFAFDLPAPVIDANIERVLARLTNFSESVNTSAGKAALKRFAAALQPQSGARLWNSALMELGALLCRSGTPDCLLCPVASFCAATNPESLPVKPPRARITSIAESRVIYLHGGRIYLERSNGPRWKGLWILPATRATKSEEPVAVLVHGITRHRVTLSVFIKKSRPPSEFRGFLREELAALPMPAPHRRALQLAGVLESSKGHA
jgi:A/G-specific adenine glycosylase